MSMKISDMPEHLEALTGAVIPIVINGQNKKLASEVLVALLNNLIPFGDQNQVLAIDGNNTSELKAIDPLEEGYFVTSPAELATAKTKIISQAAIFNLWKRFSMGQDNGTGVPIAANGIPGAPLQTNSFAFNAGANKINSTQNTSTYIGFVSPDKYTNYTHQVTLAAGGVDNDAISVVIAFIEDEEDMVTNLAFGLNPANFDWPINVTDATIANQHTISLVRSRTTQFPTFQKRYSIVYDMGKSTQVVLINGESLSGLWNTELPYGTPGVECDVKVIKEGNIVKCYVTNWSDAPGGKGALGFEIIYDLSLNLLTHKFQGAVSYGYGALSQDTATFSGISITPNKNSIYDLNTGDVWVASGSTYSIDTAITYFSEFGVRRFLWNPDTKKLIYVNPDQSFKVIYTQGETGTGGGLDAAAVLAISPSLAQFATLQGQVDAVNITSTVTRLSAAEANVTALTGRVTNEETATSGFNATLAARLITLNDAVGALSALGIALGNLSSLTTTDQSSAVAAINEVKGLVALVTSGGMKGFIAPATAAITPTVNDSYRLTSAGTYTNFLSAAATPITFAPSTEGFGIVQYNTATGFWTKITAAITLSMNKTVTNVSSTVPDFIGQIGVDTTFRLYRAYALSGTDMWKRLPRTADCQWFFLNLAGGLVKSGAASITFKANTSVYLQGTSPIQIRNNTGADVTFTFSAASKILMLDTTKTYTALTPYRIFEVTGANAALVEKVSTDLPNPDLIPLCTYYDGVMQGFGIGSWLQLQAIPVPATLITVASPVPVAVGQTARSTNNRNYIARTLSTAITNGPTAENWEKIVNPAETQYMLEPWYGTVLGVTEVTSNSIKFTDNASIFALGNMTYEIQAQSAYTFTFSATSKILCLDLKANWVLSGSYRRYQAGGVDNALVEKNGAEVAADAYLFPLAGFFNSAIDGYVLGDYLAKKRAASASTTSPYRSNTDRVVNAALRYNLNELAANNFMFVQMNDIHVSVGNEDRVSNFAEAITFLAEAKVQIPQIKFGISNGDLCDGRRTSKASHAGDIASYMGAYANTVNLWANSLGNHDDNSAGNIFANTYTKAEQRAAFIDPMLAKFAAFQAPASPACYYYWDDTATKVRCIVLDPTDQPRLVATAGTANKYQGLVDYAFSQTQLSWLVDTALNVSALTTPTAWTVVVFCHVPIRNTALGAFKHPTSIIPRIMNAFKSGITVTESYTDTTNAGDFSYSVTKNFATLNGGGVNFAGYFSGHRHRDYINLDTEFTDQSNIIMLNGWALRDMASPIFSLVNRSLSTATQNSFDLVILNTNTKKVRTIRFGAGQTVTDDYSALFQRSFTY